MRIAQVAPLYEAVPPKYYGGTERVVSYLTEELVRQGHRVTLFASGDSVTRAELVPICPQALRLDRACVDRVAPHVVMLEKVLQAADRFDVIHFHIDYLHFPLTRRIDVPHVTTLHGRLDAPELRSVYDEFSDVPVVSISDAQRRPMPQANWQATVYHGLPPGLYRHHDRPGDYLAFLGRVSAEKRIDRALEIARRTGLRLKVAAKIDAADADYFRTVEPFLKSPEVEFVGEIGERDKGTFLGGARALLFPIDWPEPFGLVMIEAMRCGTPVIAWPCGSVPELIEDGLTGFVVNSIDDAVRAVQSVGEIDRRRCRGVFEERFSVSRMAA
ncbi:MAG TPA: glycosyltransferase family 4 protein, partial [Gemmataceae bacterium]|nr:glycosyltransferase family 4 protein [Gemmataceae bacterium]